MIVIIWDIIKPNIYKKKLILNVVWHHWKDYSHYNTIYFYFNEKIYILIYIIMWM